MLEKNLAFKIAFKTVSFFPMLANRHTTVTVNLALISKDLPFGSEIKTKASMWQKDAERFHLLLNQQQLPQSIATQAEEKNDVLQWGIFWLDISPYQVTMTMQSDGELSYRHFWERGIYGTSKYCLNTESNLPSQSLILRNFTRSLTVHSDLYPSLVRIEYEMWSAQLHLGSYILQLQID
jgi:hypothetical protein